MRNRWRTALGATLSTALLASGAVLGAEAILEALGIGVEVDAEQEEAIVEVTLDEGAAVGGPGSRTGGLGAPELHHEHAPAQVV